MRRAALLLLLAASASAEDWLLPRGDLQNTGVVKNKGPKKAPQVLWTREEKDVVQGGAALCGGRLFYGVGEFAFVCRSTKAGAHIWEKPVKQAVVAWPAIQGEFVVFGGQDHVHYRLKMGNMDEPNTHEANGPTVASPAVTETHFLSGSTDGFFYAMDLKSGSLLWNHKTGPVRHAPALLKNTVFVVNETGVLHALDLKAGKLLWKVEAGAAPQAPPIVGAGVLVLPVADAILKFESKTGESLGRIDAPGLRGTPALEKPTLLYGNEKGELVAVDVGKSSETRRAKVAEEPVAGALVIAGKVVFGSAGKTLFALDVATLETLWTYKGEEPFTSPIVADGAIYAAAGKVFYCLR